MEPKHTRKELLQAEGIIALGSWCALGASPSLGSLVKQPHSRSRMNWFVRNEIITSGLIDKVFYR